MSRIYKVDLSPRSRDSVLLEIIHIVLYEASLAKFEQVKRLGKNEISCY